MAPSGEHRPESLGQAEVRAAAVATGNAAITLRAQVKAVHENGKGMTVAKACEILTEQAGIAEKVSANLAVVADALKIREDAAKAWNRDAAKDSEIEAARKAVTDAQQQLRDASAASGDISAASAALEAAQKKLKELKEKRKLADEAYDKAEKRAAEKLGGINRDEHGVDGRAGTPGNGTPAPSAGTGRPSGEAGKRTDPSKTPTAGTAKPSATPSGTPSPSSAKPAETNTATPESAAALAALLGQQQQQPAAQAQPAAATPTAAPVASTPQQPDKAKDTPQSKSNPLDRILGSDGVFDLDDAARALGPTAVALGGGSAPTTSAPSTPAAAVTPTAPATPAPSTTGLSAGTVTQPTTSGTSATNLHTTTDVSGRPAEQQRTAFSVGPETKTSGATSTGTSGTTPAHATGTRPMGAGGMPMMGPMGGMGGPAGGGAAKEKEPTALAAGSEEAYILHGRAAVDSAVPGGTIAQRDHPRRRPPESDAA